MYCADLQENVKIIEAVRNGEQLAFEFIFRKYYLRLRCFAMRLVKNETVAEDITQEVFTTIWEQRNSLNENKELKSYLFQITRNSCLNYLKRNNVEQRYYNALLYENSAQELFALNFLDEQEQKELKDELYSEINRALGTLSPQCRKAFELSKFKQMKNKEVAELMGLNIKTVEKHISKAMRTIRETLKHKPLLLYFLFVLFEN